MKRILFIALACVLMHQAYAQLQDRVWIFGRPTSGSTNATFYFDDPPVDPVATLPCGQPSNITTTNGAEGWAVITNPYTGHMIFYTDGINVFDAQHDMVDLDPLNPGFEPLGANNSSAQPVVCCLVPGTSAGQFYIFSNGTGASGSSWDIGTITYRLYDALNQTFGQQLSLPGPFGSTSVAEGMQITRSDSDPNVLWLITTLYPSAGNENRYVVYKIEGASVTYQGYCDMGPDKICPTGGLASPITNITYTRAGMPSGTTLFGFALQHTSSIFTCEFDNVNGNFNTSTLRQYITGFGSIPSLNDMAFSPSGRFIYYSVYYTTSDNNAFYQLDLQDPVLSPVLINTFNERYAGGVALGPDGLVYHNHDGGYYTHQLHVGRVLTPDVEYVPGVTNYSSFYQEDYHVFPNTVSFGFPEFLIIPRELNAVEENEEVPALVYPNPTHGMITIDQLGYERVSIFDPCGSLILDQELQKGLVQIDLSAYPQGLYTLQLFSDKGVMTRKLVRL